MSDVKIRIDADGVQVAKAFEDIRKAMERAGQAGRELSKIDLSHPELKAQAEDLRKIIAHYEELKRVWKQLGDRTKATGQSGAAPWDLDLARMYPAAGQAARAQQTLGQRLLSGTAWAARLPHAGGGGITGGRGGGIGGGVGGAIASTIGGGGMGVVGGLARGLMTNPIGILAGGYLLAAMKGLPGAKKEAVEIDPLWRRLQGTAGSFDQLRESTRELGRGLGVTYEKSVQLGSEFSRLSGSADTAGMVAGTRTAIGLARGLGMDPDAMVGFMGRSRFKGAFSGGEEKRFASMIAAGVREGGMQAAPEKVLQAVDNLTESLVRRGVSPGGQVGDMLGLLSSMNKSGNPALRGEYGASILGQISQGMMSPGMGAAGQLFMAQALGEKDPFKAALMAEQGPLARLKNGSLAIESIFSNLRRIVPGGPEQRADAFANLFNTTRTQAMALEKLIANNQAQGIQTRPEDVLKIAPELGGNQGADIQRLLTGMHNSLTVAAGPLLMPVGKIASATDYLAGMFGYKTPPPPPEASGKIERRGVAESSAADPIKRRIRAAIDKEAGGDPKMAKLIEETIRLESGFSPRAGIGTGYVGLGQQSPDTARRFGIDPSERTNIEKAVHVTAEYLKFNKQAFGRYDLAGGAYLSGEGNMRDYLDGKRSQVGPQTLDRMHKIGQLGLDPPMPALPTVRGSFDLNVIMSWPGGGKTAKTIPVPIGTPTPNGKATVAVP